MAEYIERKAATLAVCQEQENAFHKLIDGTHVTVFAFDVKKRIDKIPAADVQPVRHGRWVYEGRTVASDEDGCQKNWCCCSECGDWLAASDEYAVRGRFCPNCGAKMDGGE